MSLQFKSYCWSLGSTSFRTKDFNKSIEEQLAFLEEFWLLEENKGKKWLGNNKLQARYYNFIKEKGFVKGNAPNKPKDAREKTSGLVDVGLLTNNRELSAAGKELLRICSKGDFVTNNQLQIPKDSFIYLKQLLKTSTKIEDNNVRPFVVLLYLLEKFGYLTKNEFTYLLPLCIGPAETDEIVKGLKKVREGISSVDDILLERLMRMENYQEALAYFLNNQISEDLICTIGLNRKSRKYDKEYFSFYKALADVFLNKKSEKIVDLYEATGKIKTKKWWRKFLFNTPSRTAIKKDPSSHLKQSVFNEVQTEKEFKIIFFKTMHLFKAKATLSDYLDLNRRYIKTTNVILFEDDLVKLDILPKHFFSLASNGLFPILFTTSDKLYEDCELEKISSAFSVDTEAIFNAINKELDTDISDIQSARKVLEKLRYERLQRLIKSKFSSKQLLSLLNHFEQRNDKEIQCMVTDNADIPTIFEYVLGILWYKVSEQKGGILDYMKLSLDADLLPKTHAGGGEADIVYEYEQSNYYPKHTLLLEATLADKTNQRRMEMEPVSRHLGRYLLSNKSLEAYCVFATNYLDINVISDFRMRKTQPFYDTQDNTKFVEGMKIIPLQTSELKQIIKNNKTYKDLYPLFAKAFHSNLPPHEWYNNLQALISS